MVRNGAQTLKTGTLLSLACPLLPTLLQVQSLMRSTRKRLAWRICDCGGPSIPVLPPHVFYATRMTSCVPAFRLSCSGTAPLRVLALVAFTTVLGRLAPQCARLLKGVRFSDIGIAVVPVGVATPGCTGAPAGGHCTYPPSSLSYDLSRPGGPV